MDRQSDLIETEEIDLRQYVSVVLKWKWMILLFTVGALLTSYIVSSFLMTPVYETTAVLMATHPNYERVYREENGSLESTVDSFSRQPYLNLNTYIGQFKNTEILISVIDKLNLDKLDYTPRSLAQDITINGNKDTNMIEVKVLNTDPALAESIANTLVDEFYAFLFISNQKQAKESVAYLASQLEQAEEELKKVSEEYQQNQAQARNSSILEKELISKTEILTNSKTLLLQSKVELEQLIAGRKRLEENLADTPAKLVTKTWTEGSTVPEIPEIEQLDLEMETANTNMVSEEINPLYLELIKELNQKDAEIAQTEAKIAGISGNISSLEREIADIQVELSEKQLAEATVKRKLATLENAYTVLNEKIIQTEITKSADFGRMNLTMVSPAFQPTSPVKPNKLLNMAIAAILGLMGGIFLAFVLEFFDDTVKTAEDLKRLMDVPVLATIPTGKQS
ncbi:MAG: GumC family protein [Bacillota bacterium]|jgi:succinoglycan biosynthesis transport protein ExoP